MPYTSKYKPFIKKETKVSKGLVEPRNLYRITSYEYADGTTKSLVGEKSSLIFVTGIYDKKLSCIKINELKPEKFFEWVSKLKKRGIKEEELSESKMFSEYIILSDKGGQKLYEAYVKPSPLLKSAGKPVYRTYNLSGINNIYQIQLKIDKLKDILL